MEIAKKVRSFKEAQKNDIHYYKSLTPSERIAIVRQLQKRVYGEQKDMRDEYKSNH